MAEKKRQESKKIEMRAAQREAKRRAAEEAAVEQAKRDEQRASIKKRKEENKAVEFAKQWQGKHIIVVDPGSPYVNKTGIVVSCYQRSGLETVAVRFDGLPANAAPRTLRSTAVKIAGKWGMQKHAVSEDAAALQALNLENQKADEARATNAQMQLTLLAASSARSPRQTEMKERRVPARWPMTVNSKKTSKLIEGRVLARTISNGLCFNFVDIDILNLGDLVR